MRSYRIVNPNLQKRKKFPPENFPQVRHRYIFLNFQNFQEGRDVKIANGKITLCAESGTAFTDFCKCPGGLRLHRTLTKPHLLQFLSAISEHAAEELAAVYSEKEIVGGNQHHGNLIA
ncbi:MAG: hypothetical protein MR881_06305 [Bacteroidales bacterium]|nr:hypothetical protein [Bacteroidales bacterium]